MRYSTRTRYGLRLLINLGHRDSCVFVQLADIAHQEGISVKYLEQIIRTLRPSGILRSARGAKGGYALALNPKDIFLDQIFFYLEGTLAPVACVERAGCSRQNLCQAKCLWQELDVHIRSFLHSISLQQLLDWHPEENTRLFANAASS